MGVAIIVGDIHLGKGVSIGKPGVGNALNSRVVDQLKLLDWVVDQAIEQNAAMIILTGDICEDPKPDYRLVDIFVKFLKRCEHTNIEVHIVSGNHDIKRTGTQYISVLDILTSAELPMAHVYKKPATIFMSGAGITLFPFKDRGSLNCASNAEAIEALGQKIPYEASEIPDNYDRILVGHLALEGSIFVGDESDSLANELMCPVSMFSDYDYIWMGHVHKPQVMSQKPYAAHIGSLDISDFGETDHVKHIVVFDSSKKERFKHIPIPSRPLRKIAIEVPKGSDPTDYVLEQIDDAEKTRAIKNSIVRINIKLLEDMENVDRQRVEGRLSKYNAFYICDFVESRAMSVVPLSKQELMDNTIGPKDAVKLYAEEEKFKSDDDKLRYIDLANGIIDKFYAKVK